ncbi:hypothetical protein TCAL_00244 [Tigriopus californicus]|uniref:Uncharacterized protein n=1 Tax=Tigriopus californicus TaxID=6832 RepID=A0A553P1D4_TIGCA|nr:uncharacterized protein LOC131883071 [Tigriopus californicus]XP_059086392.1 uncharacterized protein LOC131883071 [Tigriopus californicus]TRY71491.1 hypothetical protein TCAL_00244 [Tigriopus californicus]
MSAIIRAPMLILGVISTISLVQPAPTIVQIPQPPPGQNVFVPPDIKYWAYGKINTTVIDNLGLPWYCYTHRQTHCMPLFQKPPNFQTTRRPYGLAINQEGILQPSDIQPEQDENALNPKHRSEESSEMQLQITDPLSNGAVSEPSQDLIPHTKPDEIQSSTESTSISLEDRLYGTTLNYRDGVTEQSVTSEHPIEISENVEGNDSTSDINRDPPNNSKLSEDESSTEPIGIYNDLDKVTEQGTTPPNIAEVSLNAPEDPDDQIQFPLDYNTVDDLSGLDFGGINSVPQATYKIVDANGTTVLQVKANKEEDDADLEAETTTIKDLGAIIFGTASNSLQFPDDTGNVNILGEQSRSRSIKEGPLINQNLQSITKNTLTNQDSSNASAVEPSGVFFPVEKVRPASDQSENKNKSGKQPRMIDGFLIHAAPNTINQSQESVIADGIRIDDDSKATSTIKNERPKAPGNIVPDQTTVALDTEILSTSTTGSAPEGVLESEGSENQGFTISFIADIEEPSTNLPNYNFEDHVNNTSPREDNSQNDTNEVPGQDLDEQKHGIKSGPKTIPEIEITQASLDNTLKPRTEENSLVFEYERTEETKFDSLDENLNVATDLPSEVSTDISEARVDSHTTDQIGQDITLASSLQTTPRSQISSSFDSGTPRPTISTQVLGLEQANEETTIQSANANEESSSLETTKLYNIPTSSESSPFERATTIESATNTTDPLTSPQEKTEPSFDVLGNSTDELLNRVLNILSQNQTQTNVTIPQINENMETTTDPSILDEESLMQRNRNPKQSGPNCKSCNIAIQFSRPENVEKNEINQDIVILPGDQGYHWKYEVDDELIQATTASFDIRIFGGPDNGIDSTTTTKPMMPLSNQNEGTLTIVDEPVDVFNTTTSSSFITLPDVFSSSIEIGTGPSLDETTPQDEDIESNVTDEQIDTLETTQETIDFSTTTTSSEIDFVDEMLDKTTTHASDVTNTSTGSSINVNASIFIEEITTTAMSIEDSTSVPTPLETSEDNTSTIAAFETIENTASTLEPFNPVEENAETTKLSSTTVSFATSEPVINSTAQPRLDPDDLLNSLLFDVGDVISNQISSDISPLSPLVPEDTPVLAPAYTVFGEKCNGTCEDRGYSYTWCYKLQPSNIGTWRDSDYCSNHLGITPYGESCIDGCEKRSYDYYWCHKSTLWGYCVPDHLLQMANTWKTLFGEQPLYAREFMDTQPAPSYTIYGKLCQDQCQAREEDFTYCAKANPRDLGTWHLKDYCTNNSTTEVTHEGIKCNDDCLRRGSAYFWCHTDNGYGYCTPKILIQKSGRFAITSTTSTSSTTPGIGKNDVDYEYENEIAGSPNELKPEALAFTVFGEPCLDPCSNYENTSYTWCHKIEGSDTGTWFDRNYCTNRANVTQFGVNCLDECSKRDQAYYWCHKELALWGFCTPQFLLDQIRQRDST